ncbi:hypothetical protein VNO78_19864 [Psophocarpus tetragonolobus]|uniref:Uncharacterized protein n=1 Tax=Psophocarpus tetragonolobus TaxID=3891 RepID=A0AAN9XH07_PSOTE
MLYICPKGTCKYIKLKWIFLSTVLYNVGVLSLKKQTWRYQNTRNTNIWILTYSGSPSKKPTLDLWWLNL